MNKSDLSVILRHKILRKDYYWTDFPTVIQVDTNNHCGPTYSKIFCEYCKPQDDIVRGKRCYAEMPMDWIEWIQREIARDGKSMHFIAYFLNGDGLTEPRLPEILAKSKRTLPWLETQTFTCGSNTQNADLLCDGNLDWVCFTLSAHTRELYKIIHRGDRFENVVKTMRYVNEHHAPHQKLEVHYVITHHNLPYMKDWYDWIGQEFPGWKRVFSPLVASSDNEPSLRALGTLTVGQQEDAIMKVDPSTKFWKRNLATLRQPCVLWNNCAIDVDGWMLQCCNWSNLGYNYGNIKEYIEEGRSLRDYWMERLANKQRNSLCRSCNLKHPNVCNRLSDIKVRMSIPSFETRQARAHI